MPSVAVLGGTPVSREGVDWASIWPPRNAGTAITDRALGMHHAVLGQPDREIEGYADAIEKVATHVGELRAFAADRA